MIPYILYAALILSACLIFYKLLLQKETFFRLNRFILLACMMLAFILPVIQVPQQMSFRKATAAVKIILTEPSFKLNHTARATEENAIPANDEQVQKNQLIN